MKIDNESISAAIVGVLFGAFALTVTALWNAEQACSEWHPPLNYPEQCR